MAAIVHQQCWNHASREAVCRCLGCSRAYCRECVAEHESRLLCTQCLKAAIGAASSTRKTSAFRHVLLVVAGLVLSTAFFLALAGGVSEWASRAEAAAWQKR